MIPLRKIVESATWARFALAFAAWSGFNFLAFYRASPWTRALEAGERRLPESQFGFPADEPQRSLALLAEKGATGDYLIWQALDIPYAALNVAVSGLAIALALKATRLAASPLRLALLLPAAYFAAELVENALVAGLAANLIAPEPALAAVQQAATAIKGFCGFGAMGLGLAALAVAGLAALIGLARSAR